MGPDQSLVLEEIVLTDIEACLPGCCRSSIKTDSTFEFLLQLLIILKL